MALLLNPPNLPYVKGRRMQMIPSQELEDIRRLARTVVTLFVLRFVVAFQAHRWVTHDAASFLSYYRDLFLLPSWEALSMQPELFGGAPTYQTAGTYPLMEWCGKLGLSPIDAFGFQSFFLSCLLAFFGLKLTTGLLERYEAPPMSGMSEILGASMLGFAPFLALRLPIGHWNLVYGLLPFQALWSLWVQDKNHSLLHGGLVTLGVYLGLGGQGGQSWLSTLLWGGTWIALETLCAPKKSRAQALLTLAYGALGLCCILPRFLPVLRFALGPESIRSLGSLSDHTIYSYLTPTVLDVWRSLSMDASVIPQTLAAGFHHEAHMPIGFGLLAFLLLPFLPRYGHRLKFFLLGFLFSLLALTLLMCNIEPFSHWMLRFPPLRWFRVPLRMLMPLALITPSFLLFVLHAFPFRYQPRHLLGSLITPLPPMLHFLACLGLVSKQKLWPALLVGLATSSVYQFYQKMPTPFSRAELEEEPKILGQQLRSKKPELDLALNRVHLDFQLAPFHINSGHALGLSTAVGYGFPTRRYFEFLETLFQMHIPPQTTVLSLPFEKPPLSKPFQVLQQLFNVRFFIQRRSDGPTFEAYPASQAAWIPHTAFQEDSLKTIQTALKATPERLRETLWSASPHIPSALCKEARVVALNFPHGTSEFQIQVDSPGLCPLVLSTLYLDAWNLKGSHEAVFETFPAYGLLLGAWIPKGKHTISGSAAPLTPLLFYYLPILPLLLIFWLERKKSGLDASR
jgi:hypothetical protein